MRKEERRVRGYSELCLHFELSELPDKDIEGMSELENEVYQDLMRAVRGLSGAGDELRRRQRRRKLVALPREALEERLNEIRIRREALAPARDQDRLDEPLLVEILSAKKPRRGTRR